MNCEQIQDELLLQFGQEHLPELLARHLEDCAECRAFWAEMSADSKLMPADEAFFPTEKERGAVLRGVRTRLVAFAAEARQGFFESLLARLRQGRLVPLAATAAVLTALWIGYVGTRPTGLPDMLTADTTSVSATYALDDSEQLDDSTVDVLLYEFSTSWSRQEPGSLLLDDLTEEELRYLESNFDVGDIL